MSITQERPTTPPAGFGRPTMHGPRRRRWPSLVLVVALAGVAAIGVGVVATGHGPWQTPVDHHEYLGTDGWPAAGQGAYQLGDGAAHVSAAQQPVSIASVAKVMTAYVVLEKYPLTGDESGPSITVTATDVADTERRRANDESIVDVEVGESLTEREALEALLLPSANNIAKMLAIWSAGSLPTFVDRMNAEAALLKMRDTSYTDPSGYDAATSSTAADQLKLAEVVAKIPVLAEIMAMPSADLPVAGTVHNTDTLLGKDGFVGMKTGSTDSAGGCFMFHARRTINGHTVDLIGVVLGQPPRPHRPQYESALTAARQLADQVAPASLR